MKVVQSVIEQGDCLTILKAYPDDFFDLIVTSPPYADSRTKSYGGIAPDEYVDWFLPRSAEFLRVLKPTGTFVLNIKERVVAGQRHTYVMHYHALPPSPSLVPRSHSERILMCTHHDQIHDVTPSAQGCEDCLKIGGRWVHLRICLTCGHVGCCDNSPNRHATKHYHATGHPIIQSFQPGENWRWCYIDQELL